MLGLDEPVPAGLDNAWQVFHALSMARTRTATGAWQPISFTEADAYVRLFEADLALWEMRLVFSLDRIWMNEMSLPEAEVAAEIEKYAREWLKTAP